MAEKWTQRTFRFDIPPARMPFLMERLRGTAARIEEKIRGVPTDLLTRREARTWSVQENIGHLLDLEDLHLARLGELAEGVAALRPADMTNQKTWDANHNATPLPELLQGFRAARQLLVDRLEAWEPAGLETSAMHPRLQVPMRVIDLAYFTAEHDDYHLSRMHELLTLFSRR